MSRPADHAEGTRREGARREGARRPGRAATVGVYGFTLATFLHGLRTQAVGVVVDVRQRRGVRGSEYAWANSRRLQAALADAGVGYLHRRDLAPTTELRQLQYREDDRLGVGKRSRIELAPEYRRRYTTEILDRVDLGGLLDEIPSSGSPAAVVFALLCVERDPEACHRSIIADRLTSQHGLQIIHLRP